jgi:hypothetical protein
MTEYNVEFVRWRAGLDWRSSNANRAVEARAWWAEFRDQWRTALAAAGAFKVGDIFRWTGVSGHQGHGFLIRHATLGEWLFIGSADGNNGSDAAYLSQIIGATITNYIQSDDGSPGSATFYSGLCVAYNPDPSTSWAIGYDADLELASGDFTAPTQNPYSAVASFWTATKAPHAVGFNESVCVWSNETRLHMFICDERGMLRVDALSGSSTGQQSNATKIMVLCGQGFDTYAAGGLADAGDTNQAFMGVWGWNGGATNFTAGEGGAQIFHWTSYVTPAGSRIATGTANPTNALTFSGYKAMSGKPLSYKVPVASGGTPKGNLKTSVCLEAFPYRDGNFFNTRLEWPASSGLYLIKEHRALCFMWRADKVSWPFGFTLDSLP